MGIDSLVLLATSVAAAGGPGGTWLTLLLAGLAPTIRASFEWGQLLYFDLKRLEAPLFTNLRARFDREALRLAVALGLIFSIVAVLVASVVMGLREIHVVGLPPLLIGASLLGAAQVEAFAAGDYRRAALGGLVLCRGGRPGNARASRSIRSCCSSSPPGWRRPPSEPRGGRLAGRSGEGSTAVPTAWLARLAAQPGPVRLGRAELAPGRPSPATMRRGPASIGASGGSLTGSATWCEPRTPSRGWRRGPCSGSRRPTRPRAGFLERSRKRVGRSAPSRGSARSRPAPTRPAPSSPGTSSGARPRGANRPAASPSKSRFHARFPTGSSSSRSRRSRRRSPQALRAIGRAVLWEAARFIRSLGRAAGSRSLRCVLLVSRLERSRWSSSSTAPCPDACAAIGVAS